VRLRGHVGLFDNKAASQIISAPRNLFCATTPTTGHQHVCIGLEDFARRLLKQRRYIASALHRLWAPSFMSSIIAAQPDGMDAEEKFTCHFCSNSFSLGELDDSRSCACSMRFCAKCAKKEFESEGMWLNAGLVLVVEDGAFMFVLIILHPPPSRCLFNWQILAKPSAHFAQRFAIVLRANRITSRAAMYACQLLSACASWLGCISDSPWFFAFCWCITQKIDAETIQKFVDDGTLMAAAPIKQKPAGVREQ
jgi:hypothetical protein